MSYLNINLDDVQEQKAAPKGQYEVTITGAEETVTGENSKHPGSPMIKVFIAFTDLELNAANMTHYISLPFEGDENANFKLLMLKRFLHLFKLAKGGEVNLESTIQEMPGAIAQVEVDLTEPNDNGDVYNRLRIPKLKDEHSRGKGHPPR